MSIRHIASTTMMNLNKYCMKEILNVQYILQNSQMKIFHGKMEPKKYYRGPDSYAELGRLGFSN